MRLPLVRFPKRAVYIDDKGQFLEILRRTMPAKLGRQFFDAPQAAIDKLKQEAGHWSKVQEMLTRFALNSDGGLGQAAMYAASYFTDWRRFQLSSVLVVDYAMPGMDGLEMLRRLGPWPGRKILLTGEADATVAIQGFNAGLIQKFLPKSTLNLQREIVRHLDDMHVDVCEHFGQLVLSTLSREQADLLDSPEVVKGINAQIDMLEWIEYVVVGQPFGLLGMSNDGPLQFLQLEQQSDLAGLADLAEDFGISAADAEHVRRGTALIDCELASQMEKPTQVLWDVMQISTTPPVLAAVVDLAIPVLNRAKYGVDDVLTLDEEMRALLRHVTETSKHAETLAALADGKPSSLVFADMRRGAEASAAAAISHLAAVANISILHRGAMKDALAVAALPPALALLISAAIESAASAKAHGNTGR